MWQMSDVPSIRLDKTALSVASLHEESDDKAYWLSRTPAERLEAAELMRQVNYGYDPTTVGLQRVLEVIKLGER